MFDVCGGSPCCTDAPGGEGGSSLSGPVVGSVSSVLGLDAVVLGDGGVSSGAVGRYVSVCGVSCGDDMALCGVNTVFSVAVSGGLCELARLPGGGDTAVTRWWQVLSVNVCVALTVCLQVPYSCACW